MVDPQQIAQVAQTTPQFINWSINVPDLSVLLGCAFMLYGRMVKIETQIAPIVEWWNQVVNAEHRIGRRWTDDSQPGPPVTGMGGFPR